MNAVIVDARAYCAPRPIYWKCPAEGRPGSKKAGQFIQSADKRFCPLA
jgi:hypothetical protein